MIAGGSRASLPIAPGDVLADRYVVDRLLGTGGFSAVYLVNDTVLKDQRALKVVIAGEGKAANASEQILHEFKLQEKITDTGHIVRSDDPRPCEYKGLSLVLLPMPFADGGSLRQWLAGHPDVVKRQEAALKLFQEACQGAKAIHDAGLVHLDVKPENILLVDGKAKLTDFGIGRYADSRFAKNPDQLVRQGVGTPRYMSPEQFRVARQQDVGPASDIYSLGLVLYELLDGAPPFDGTPSELREKHLSVAPLPLKDRAALWWPVVERCLAKEPQRRYPSVQHLLTDLQRAAEGAALSVDVACPACRHINANKRRQDCENCHADLGGLFRECPKCLRRNRLDLEQCEGCGFAIAAHYLYQQRKQTVAQLKDEDPVEAIELLETMLRAGASDEEAALIKSLRQTLTKIQPWITEAGKAGVSGQPEQAVKLWRKVLTAVPRHRSALAQIELLDALLKDVSEQRDRAIALMDQAEFDDADRLLQACLERIPNHQTIRELLEAARTRATKYPPLLEAASAAETQKALREALGQVDAALAQAPESPAALNLKKRVSSAITQGKDLVEQARELLKCAEFDVAQRCVEEIEHLQADQEDVTGLRNAVAKTRKEYEKAKDDAEQARREHDLEKAAKRIARALQLCPDSPAAQATFKSVQEDQDTANELVKSAQAATKAALFSDAEQALGRVLGLWPSAPGLQAASQALAEVRGPYAAQLERARQAEREDRLSEASDACAQALKLCPKSAEAKALQKSIRLSEEANDARRREKEDRARARREKAKNAAATSGKIIAALAALAVVVCCAVLFWRWLNATAFPWLAARNKSWVCANVVLLGIAAVVHGARDTSFYQQVFSDFSNRDPNRHGRSMFVMALILGLVCGVPAAGLGALLMYIGVLTPAHSIAVGLVACMGLGVAALLHALFVP